MFYGVPARRAFYMLEDGSSRQEKPNGHSIRG